MGATPPKGRDVDSRLSVVVPTHNRRLRLARLLDALARQTASPREVVIVDDCSDDNTVDFCRSWGKENTPFELRLIRLRRNLGPAAARNMGVAHATAPVVLFTDDDCEPDKDWIRSMGRAFQEDPFVAGIGGPVRAADALESDAFFDYHHLHDPKFDAKTASPLYLVTANAAYRREWILKVGGFDEDLTKPGGEDPGLSFKIRSAGGTLGYAKGAVVRHHFPAGVKSVARMFENYGFGACLVVHAYSLDQTGFSHNTGTLPYDYLQGEALSFVSSTKQDSTSKENVELRPPYLREIPREIALLESSYKRHGFSLRRRLTFHMLWIVFRLSYYRGWKQAEPVTQNFPHLRLSR